MADLRSLGRKGWRWPSVGALWFAWLCAHVLPATSESGACVANDESCKAADDGASDLVDGSVEDSELASQATSQTADSDSDEIRGLVFENQASEPMEVWWQSIDEFSGAERQSSKVLDVPSGTAGTINTFIGHVFLWVRPPRAESDAPSRGELVETVHVFRNMPHPIYRGADLKVSFEAFFHNMGTETMELWWEGPTGGKKVMDLLPDSVQKISTYEGHIFHWVRASTGTVEMKVRVHRGMIPSRYPSVTRSDDIDAQVWPHASVDNDCEDKLTGTVCKNQAAHGACESGPGWMTVHCGSTCGFCHLRDPKLRCFRKYLNVSDTPAWKPGDMEAMFSSLPSRVRENQPQVNVTVLSSDPHVVSFDNFVTEEEIKELLASVRNDFQRSTDQGGFDESGVQAQVTSTSRTSENAWCREKCVSNPAVRRIISRIEELVGVPRANFESFQVLRYNKDQYYKAHHDESGSDSMNLPAGPRIMTFFMYLSDVEEGGETAFPKLPGPLVVRPRKGSAILWPSVLDQNPEASDPRMIHEARPVKRGVKLAANSWIHLYDYRRPNLWGCTGSFG